MRCKRDNPLSILYSFSVIFPNWNLFYLDFIVETIPNTRHLSALFWTFINWKNKNTSEFKWFFNECQGAPFYLVKRDYAQFLIRIHRIHENSTKQILNQAPKRMHLMALYWLGYNMCVLCIWLRLDLVPENSTLSSIFQVAAKTWFAWDSMYISAAHRN